MSRADENLFDLLHSLTVSTIIEQVKVYTENRDEKGNLHPLAVPPALLAQAIKLLKDNGIDSPARAKKLDEALPADLPSFDDVADAHMGVH